MHVRLIILLLCKQLVPFVVAGCLSPANCICVLCAVFSALIIAFLEYYHSHTPLSGASAELALQISMFAGAQLLYQPNDLQPPPTQHSLLHLAHELPSLSELFPAPSLPSLRALSALQTANVPLALDNPPSWPWSAPAASTRLLQQQQLLLQPVHKLDSANSQASENNGSAEERTVPEPLKPGTSCVVCHQQKSRCSGERPCQVSTATADSGGCTVFSSAQRCIKHNRAELCCDREPKQRRKPKRCRPLPRVRNAIASAVASVRRTSNSAAAANAASEQKIEACSSSGSPEMRMWLAPSRGAFRLSGVYQFTRWFADVTSLSLLTMRDRDALDK